MQDLNLTLKQFLIETKDYMAGTVAEMLEQELPVLTEESFALFETTGNRLVYEQEYFAKRKFLTVFGVTAQWMKQKGLKKLGEISYEQVIQKLEEILCSICAEECWALPAHVNRRANSDWRNSIDLFASETAQSLTDIVDELDMDLDSQCKAIVRENVIRRVLKPFFETPTDTYDWERSSHNWNAVCNGSIASAYLHSLTKGEAARQEYLDRICESLLSYIDGFAEDGTCMEGLGYYFYGMTYWVNIAEELYAYSKGKLDLLQGCWGTFEKEAEDKRSRIAAWWSECFFVNGRTVSFSDGSSREKYRIGLACALSERFPKVELPDISRVLTLEEDACYRYLPFKMDLFCTDKYLNSLKNQRDAAAKNETEQCMLKHRTASVNISRCTILEKAQWCICEASNKAGFACKGGHNGEPHNHNDTGSFFYLVGEDMFLTDLGAGEYTAAYFGEGRYDILCNRSLGHNLPLINGEEQLPGTEHKCNDFKAIENEQKICISMDLTKAYETNDMKCFTRCLTFEKESGTLIVEDFFEGDGKMRVTENLITQLTPQIRGNTIFLIGTEKKCEIQIGMANKKPEPLLKVIPMEHSNHSGEKEQVYLIQWDVYVNHKADVKISIHV